ncbi:MAG: hypothetical protein ACXVCY_19275 [Pseudobdellovibrionaceae bacterium]
MLRAGRFRHRLLDDTFLKEQTSYCIQCLQSFLNLWKSRNIDDVEIATVYILIFAFFRRPNDFLGGVHNEDLLYADNPKSISSKQVVEILCADLPMPLKNAKSLERLKSSEPFVDYFCSLSWRSIPLSVAKSLCAWRSGRYSLNLLTYVPTPEEVLLMQTQGQRCVSMLIEPEQIRTFVDEGRDVLGFIVHDLIHADHFFADQEKARAQIQFCQKLLTVLNFFEIQQMLDRDAIFKSEFHYLMSDMNSVPLHLLKTLKAILLGYFKRQWEISMQDPLPANREAEFHALFEFVLTPWGFSKEALDSARRLNTKQYNASEDNELLHLALLS